MLKNEFLQLIKSREGVEITEKLRAMIDFIRPKNLGDIQLSVLKMDAVADLFKDKDEIAVQMRDEINLLFINLKLSTNISDFGILSKKGFGYELRERFYNKFMPNPPKQGELEYIFANSFSKSGDDEWVGKIEDERWLELFGAIFWDSQHIYKVKSHLFYELLHAAEILAVRIASEEFDDSFVRLDSALLSKESAFMALQRDMGKFISKVQEGQIDIDSTRLDIRHLEVILQQCDEQVDRLKKRSVELGISLNLTYSLERLKQIVRRIEEILKLIEKFDTSESKTALVRLFKEAVAISQKRNSMKEVYRQSLQMIAKSITNNIGEHGEHYITNSKKEYLKMFLSSAGAGVIIAVMALIKINIVQAQLSPGLTTLLSSLNYGLGFVFIHLIGFTVATKQPAMTASTFASEVEKQEDNRVNQNKLIELIFRVSRSQFAAVAGNVSLALLVSFGISRAVLSGEAAIINEQEAKYYLKGLEPFATLFFAAIAGVWLFCSGLIAGYFDNRADCLELKQRYFHHPLLKKLITSSQKRQKVANYLHDHHGAIVGNFLFGVLLGVTPFVGKLLDLPLDIAHVAFSSAYLGYASTHIDISVAAFLYYLFCALLIGAVNLAVSFAIALKVSLVSRDTSMGGLFSFAKNLLLQMMKRPHELIFPFKKEER